MRDLALPSYFYRQITTNEERYQLGADNLAVHYTVAKGQLYSFATEGKKQTPKTVILRADLKLDRDELAIVRRLILQGFKIYFVKDCNSSELDKFNLKSLQETPEIIHFSDYKNKTQDEILSFCANAAHKKQDEILFLDKKILLEITELNCQKSKVVFFRDIMANSGGKFQQAFEDFYGNEAITIIIDFVSPPLLEKIAFLLLEKKESVTVLYRNTELYIPLQNKQGEKYFVKKEVADALSESLMANTDNVIDLVFTPPIHFDKSLKFCENRRNIKSVTWMDFNTIHGSDLQKLATCEWISKIESLTLLGCEYIYRNEVEFDFPLQNLKKLDLTGSRITQKQFS